MALFRSNSPCARSFCAVRSCNCALRAHRYLLVQRADLCFQYADAGGHVALQFGQIRLRAACVAATGRTRGRDQGRFGLRRLKGQFRNLGRHALGIELVHRVTGQAHRLHPRHGMPVPVNDCIEMIENRIPAQRLPSSAR